MSGKLLTPTHIHTKEVPMNLLNYKQLTKEQLPEWLSTLTEKQLKDLKEQQEWYLLGYPQGTGDSDLEELLQNLDELWYPEDYK
jgi:hypothetical protein